MSKIITLGSRYDTSMFLLQVFQGGPPQTQTTQPDCLPHHEIIHENHDSKDDNILAKALVLALQKRDRTSEGSKEIETNQELSSEASQLIAHLDEIHKLKNSDVILEEEYDVLKRVILGKLNRLFESKPVD